MRTSYQISGPDPDILRPALDVHVLGGDFGYRSSAYQGSDLWSRLRAGMGLGISPNPRTDFWSLDLPSETEHYVSKLVAVATLVERPAQHGMRLPPIPNRPQLELVDTGRQMDLVRAAKLTGVDLADLRRLNSALKLGKTPPSGPHRLLVPIGSGHGLSTTQSSAQLRLSALALGGSK